MGLLERALNVGESKKFKAYEKRVKLIGAFEPELELEDDAELRSRFDGLREDYSTLKADPEAWVEELAERKEWDATLMDGLDPDEQWTEDGRCLNPEPPSEGTP